MIPQIEAADPTHLVAYEGNYGTDSGVPNHIGAMDYPRLVLNFHDYCFLHVPNGPEPPHFASICGPLERYVFAQHAQERANDSTPDQPGGPGWLLTEFGATTDTADLARITADADTSACGVDLLAVDQLCRPDRIALVGPVAPPGGHRIPTAGARSDLRLGHCRHPVVHVLRSHHGVRSSFATARTRPSPLPTVIVVPESTHYPHGYCVRVSGAHNLSRPDATRIDLVSRTATVVSVSLTAGSC